MIQQDLLYVHVEATLQRIAQDIVYFMNRARSEFENTSEETGDHVQNRYARTVILLTAFYLESASKRFAECLQNPDKDWNETEFTDLNGGVPKPIARFRAVYKHLCKAELSNGLDEVRDVFKIRNKILAHPKGRSTETVSNDGSREGALKYNLKYEAENFPKNGSQFKPNHAVEILTDAIEFIKQFHTAVDGKIAADLIADSNEALGILRSLVSESGHRVSSHRE